MKLSTRASSSFLYLFSLERNAGKVYRSVPKRFFGIRDFPYLKLGIFKQTRGEIRDLKFCAGVAGGMLNITIMITGSHEIRLWIAGLKNPVWDPLFERHVAMRVGSGCILRYHPASRAVFCLLLDQGGET